MKMKKKKLNQFNFSMSWKNFILLPHKIRTIFESYTLQLKDQTFKKMEFNPLFQIGRDARKGNKKVDPNISDVKNI